MRRKKTALDWVTIGLLGACMAFVVSMQSSLDRVVKGQNDFIAFYIGAALSGTPDLYSPVAAIDMQERLVGTRQENVLYIRPPYQAALMRPLVWLGYQAAYFVFQGLSLAALLWSVVLWNRRSPEVAAFAAFSIPVLLHFLIGQDVTFVLLGLTLSMFALREGRPFWAGLALMLCAGKPHLAALVPVVCLVRREWRALGGAAVGATGLLAISFVSDGWDWPARFVEMLGREAIHPNPSLMPTLRGAVYSLLGEQPVVVAALSVCVVGAVVWLARKAEFETAAAAAVLGGILVSYHAYVQDCVLVLIPMAVATSREGSKFVRIAAALAVAPPVYLVGLIGPPWNVAIPFALVGLLVGLAGLRAGEASHDPIALDDRVGVGT